MSADLEDSGPGLAQRLAAVEGLADRLETLERRIVTLEIAALGRGDLTVNQVRAGLGLAEFAGPSALGGDGEPSGRQLHDVQLASGLITEEEHAILVKRDACRE